MDVAWDNNYFKMSSWTLGHCRACLWRLGPEHFLVVVSNVFHQWHLVPRWDFVYCVCLFLADLLLLLYTAGICCFLFLNLFFFWGVLSVIFFFLPFFRIQNLFVFHTWSHCHLNVWFTMTIEQLLDLKLNYSTVQTRIRKHALKTHPVPTWR